MQQAVLRELYEFLGMGPPTASKEEELLHANKNVDEDGWPMSREQYGQLVDMMREDSHRYSRIGEKRVSIPSHLPHPSPDGLAAWSRYASMQPGAGMLLLV